jgi:hypothetical protein
VMSSRTMSLSAPAGGCDGLIQQEPGTGVGAALHDKQGRTSRPSFDSPVLVAYVLFLIGWSWRTPRGFAGEPSINRLVYRERL